MPGINVGQSLCTLPPPEPSECGVLLHRQTEGSVTNMQEVNASMSAYTYVYQDSYFIYHCLNPILTLLKWNGNSNMFWLYNCHCQNHITSSRVKCSRTVHMNDMLLLKVKCERKVLICVANTGNYFFNVQFLPWTTHSCVFHVNRTLTGWHVVQTCCSPLW